MPVLKFWNPVTRRYEPASGPVGVMGDAPSVQAYSNTTQSIPSATPTAVALPLADWDSHGFRGADNTRLTVPPGLGGRRFHIEGEITYVANVTGIRHASIYVNGASIKFQNENWPHSSETTVVAVDAWVTLQAGDYVQLMAAHNLGSNLDIGSATKSRSSTLTMTAAAVGQPGPQGPPGPGTPEYGPWTPFFGFDTPGNLNTAGSYNGFYSRVGRLVTIWGHLVLSTFTHTTASGGARIQGLPFPASAESEFGMLILYGKFAVASPGPPVMAYTVAGQTYMYLLAAGVGSSGWGQLMYTAFPTGTPPWMKFSGQYLTI